MNPNTSQADENLDAVLKNADLAEVDRLRHVWDLAGEVGDRPVGETSAAAQVRANLVAFAAASRRQERPRRLMTTASWMAVAASLLVGAVGIYLWLQPVVRTSAPGARIAVDLPDGSHVELNSGATLRHSRRFGETRSVELVGEAYFDIEKEARPFVVETFNADVRVVGTRFVVRSWPDSFEQRTTVTVEEGLVLVSADGIQNAVELHPGESRSVVEGAVGPVDSSAAGVASAWRNGDLIFKNTKLGIVLEDVERRFDIELNLDPPALRERPVTIALREPEQAEVVLQDLSTVLGLQYSSTGAGFVLRQD